MPSDRPVPSLASCLARASGRAFEKRMAEERYYAGIDLGTTNSSVTLVDALALLRGDTEAAVRVLPIRQRTAKGVVESPYLASVVAEVEPRDFWVGQGAREARSRGLLRGRQIFYSTKLEMGLGREPFYPAAASAEYDSPYKVAGRILQELRQAIEDEAGEEALAKVVVTVPASFQLAARKDTFRAAKLAGLALREQSLLDEPNAAFLDYVLTCRHQAKDGRHFDLTRPKNVLVFDFPRPRRCARPEGVVSRASGAPTAPAREPSWTTAVSETEAELRQLRQAAASLERASRELQSLREWSETMARLDVARALTEGLDGGALGALVGAAADPLADPHQRRTAEALLDRLTTALGLEAVGERGEHLGLGAAELAELDVRGEPSAGKDDEPACYCVVRPGWLLDGLVVARPLLEAVSQRSVSPSLMEGH